jgi:hypothetical protein
VGALVKYRSGSRVKGYPVRCCTGYQISHAKQVYENGFENKSS